MDRSNPTWLSLFKQRWIEAATPIIGTVLRMLNIVMAERPNFACLIANQHRQKHKGKEDGLLHHERNLHPLKLKVRKDSAVNVEWTVRLQEWSRNGPRMRSYGKVTAGGDR